MIDLRSDTLTHPTPAMRSAMAAAEVGDDVFGEDPTVKRLEALAAERMGQAAALFVTSGTMANLICQMVHCRRGDEMLVGDQAHIFYFEQGGSAAIGGIHPRSLPNQPDGTLRLADLEAAVRPDDVHFPRTRLIALENTHNRCAGTPLSTDYIRSVVGLAQRFNLKVHVDGARIFNAAVAQNVAPSELTAGVDSVSFCLSKGLAAPVGSLVCGSADFIAEARRARKVLGGGMRQAGVLAAAGIVALTQMVERLAEDHHNARMLAQRLAELPGLEVSPAAVKTNLVFARLTRSDMTAAELVRRLDALGVRVLASTRDKIRAVTHYQVGAGEMEAAAEVFRKVLAGKC
jgi:threonine aldolase